MQLWAVLDVKNRWAVLSEPFWLWAALVISVLWCGMLKAELSVAVLFESRLVLSPKIQLLEIRRI